MRVLEDGMKYSIMTVSRTGEGEQWSCCWLLLLYYLQLPES